MFSFQPLRVLCRAMSLSDELTNYAIKHKLNKSTICKINEHDETKKWFFIAYYIDQR